MTEPIRWDVAKRLFHAALSMEPARREAYLHRECSGAPDLLAEVQSLLSWAEESGEFLETPLVRVADLPLPISDTDPLLGESLGAWRIVDVIGRGGMGVVYRAERADAAFRRQAAIKVVRRGADAADIVDRFRRERETLAALDHPNIARVMDGGTTPEGQPYFVMEYVDGVRVDRYCDAHGLTIKQRLAIFRKICGAVQYAHQMLVVHRDIKPDNILMSRDGVPKLLDFGIARLLSDQTHVDDAATAATWLMTPDFASPEQLDGRAVTTATDVYSLGVLLHVLLTGLRPYRLTASTQAALRDELTTATLSRPSERVRSEGNRARELAAARATTPHRLQKRLAGDLDTIVLRALSRDVDARYATVEQLAEELERHRTCHPVAARGADLTYRTHRFVRRHAFALSAAVVILLLTVAGVAGVIWQASITAEAQARAERRFEDVRRLAHVFMFDVHDEIVNVPGTTRARALMVNTASQYLDGLAREAIGDFGLQRELAGAFVKVGDAQGHPTSANIGDMAGARASYERAIEITSVIIDAVPEDLEAERTRAMAHRRLADVLAWSGDTTAAFTHCDRSDWLFARVASRPHATREDRLQAAVADIKLGDVLGNPNFPNLGRRAEASASYGKALVALRGLDSLNPADQHISRYLGIILERIGTMRETTSEWREAADAYQESFAIRRVLAERAPLHTDIQRDFAIAYEKLGNVQLATNDVEAAAASYRGALVQFEQLARADPSNASAARTVAISRENLARTISRLGNHAETIDLLKAALRAHRDLAAHDVENAQANCDAARIAETLGDTWMPTRAPAGARASVPACGYWRESLQTRQRLHTEGAACAAVDDLTRVSSKLRQCQK